MRLLKNTEPENREKLTKDLHVVSTRDGYLTQHHDEMFNFTDKSVLK